MSVLFPAHIKNSSDGSIYQTVKEHCLNVANYAKINAEDIGMENTCYLAGLFHDIGKFTDEFREYLNKAANGEDVKRGSINHTFAGVRYIINSYCKQGANPVEKVAGELIAYAIGAHHGLFDIVDEDGKHGFEYRLHKDSIDYDAVVSNARIDLLNSREGNIKVAFRKASEETNNKINAIQQLVTQSKTAYKSADCMFYLALLERMILSAVIDADRRDTAEFMEDRVREVAYSKYFWAENTAFFEAKLNSAFYDMETPINKARGLISSMCKDAAAMPSGIYKLNIPTGGGKTLDSLRYALHHAEIHHKKRIIYIMPLLSIIEQNAAVIKSYVKDKQDVLEHHSNVINDKDDTEFNEKYAILTENWNSPVIITTLVQFLNTLFSHKTSSIRRMHSIANSVIIFDEVQTVPPKMLTLFNLACNFLSDICGSTIILCSATQPCFDNAEHPMKPDIPSLINLNDELLKPFERVKLVNKGAMDEDEIVSFAGDVIQSVDSLLIVCNTKTEAQKLFQKLKGFELDGVEVMHISAGMCRAHRTNLITDLRNALEHSRQHQRKVICVSTQVIEAGVDISFMSVIRLQAGMDSIVQSAGRCNRNGEVQGTAITYIVSLKFESLVSLCDIKAAKEATDRVLIRQDTFVELLSDDAIAYYYKMLFGGMKENDQDFWIGEKRTSIYELLSQNEHNIQDCEVACEYNLCQAFKEAGEEFKVFENNTYDIIVPYEKGVDIIAELCSQEGKYDIAYARHLVKVATPYTVGIFNYQLKKLQEQGGIVYYQDLGIYTLNPEFYDTNLGVITEATAQEGFFF